MKGSRISDQKMTISATGRAILQIRAGLGNRHAIKSKRVDE